eukprot:scaffold2072_cov126-Isochrysis_galbana.AAC.4
MDRSAGEYGWGPSHDTSGQRPDRTRPIPPKGTTPPLSAPCPRHSPAAQPSHGNEQWPWGVTHRPHETRRARAASEQTVAMESESRPFDTGREPCGGRAARLCAGKVAQSERHGDAHGDESGQHGPLGLVERQPQPRQFGHVPGHERRSGLLLPQPHSRRRAPGRRRVVVESDERVGGGDGQLADAPGVREVAKVDQPRDCPCGLVDEYVLVVDVAVHHRKRQLRRQRQHPRLKLVEHSANGRPALLWQAGQQRPQVQALRQVPDEGLPVGARVVEAIERGSHLCRRLTQPPQHRRCQEPRVAPEERARPVRQQPHRVTSEGPVGEGQLGARDQGAVDR